MIPLDKTTKHVFYVAHCSACDCTEDADGSECWDSPEEAVGYVLDWHDWTRTEPGKLLCGECSRSNSMEAEALQAELLRLWHEYVDHLACGRLREAATTIHLRDALLIQRGRPWCREPE